MLDTQFAQQVTQALLDVGVAQRFAIGVTLQLQHRADVFFDGEFAKNRGFLRQVAQTQTRAAVNGQMRHGLAVDGDAARIGTHQAHDHVKRSGLARTIGAK